MERLCCSLGIAAHNAEANIGRLLQRLCDHQQRQVELTEIIVVASGCTDNTEGIVLQHASEDPRICLLSQPRREGKASAMNWFIRQAREQVLVLCSADLLPALDALEHLVTPFADPEV